MSGEFKFFQGQGIVREFYVVSEKWIFAKMSGNFIISSLYQNHQMMRNRKLQGQFSYHFGFKLNHFDFIKFKSKSLMSEGLDGGVWYSLFIKNLAHYSSH